jgi:hypothetical protein
MAISESEADRAIVVAGSLINRMKPVDEIRGG